MAKLFKNEEINFSNFKIPEQELRKILTEFHFNHNKPITKSLLTWWALQNPEQELPELSAIFDMEHIYARNRMKMENTEPPEEIIESIGNKSLLERSINIRASDYKFSDK